MLCGFGDESLSSEPQSPYYFQGYIFSGAGEIDGEIVHVKHWRGLGCLLVLNNAAQPMTSVMKVEEPF